MDWTKLGQYVFTHRVTVNLQFGYRKRKFVHPYIFHMMWLGGFSIKLIKMGIKQENTKIASSIATGLVESFFFLKPRGLLLPAGSWLLPMKRRIIFRIQQLAIRWRASQYGGNSLFMYVMSVIHFIISASYLFSMVVDRNRNRYTEWPVYVSEFNYGAIHSLPSWTGLQTTDDVSIQHYPRRVLCL